jgi:hypothetical protein
MADDIQTRGAPRSPIYRVGRAPNPFALPAWAYAGPDGTFGGRFDDPGRRRGIAVDQRFRVLYFATRDAGAFGEVMARFRPDIEALVQIGAHLQSSQLARPRVPLAWRLGRRIGATVLDRALTFADLTAPETLQELRRVLAPVALALGLPDVDSSALAGPHRLLTQELSRYLYEQTDAAGQPRYAGIYYRSRLTSDWECWAAFADRLRHRVLRVDQIPANHPGIYDAARILRLAIEQDGGGRYLEP